MFHFPLYNPNYYSPRFKKTFLQGPSSNFSKGFNNLYNINSSNFKNTYFSQNISKKKVNDEPKIINLSNENNSKKNEEQNYFLELFGIKLYFDDILIISIILFLYQEGIKDDELFMCLILLLLV